MRHADIAWQREDDYPHVGPRQAQARAASGVVVTPLARAHALKAAQAASGLVSVPTSDTRQLSLLPVTVRKNLEPSEAFKVDEQERARTRVARLRMNVGSAARLFLADHKPGHRADDCLMLTLTYAGEVVQWSPKHISECLKRVRQWMKRRGWPCRYVWVSELGEKSGRLHYHVALWVPHGERIPKADHAGWWPHGMTKTERAKHAVGYLMSYLTKGSKPGELGDYPKGARVYGVGGLAEADRRVRRWLNRPAFLQARFDTSADVVRAVGGGWLNRDSGEWWPSEFRAVFSDGVLSLFRVHDHGSSALVGGPYSYLAGASAFVH